MVVGQDGDTLEVVDEDGEVEDLEHTGDGTVQVLTDGKTPEPTATPEPTGHEEETGDLGNL